MCGGIAIKWKNAERAGLTDPSLGFTKIGTEERVISYKFYDRKPKLPVNNQDKIKLVAWGNRDDSQIKLPKTGWCKIESLDAGKWDWLKPQPAIIPADFGLEKRIWFEILGGIQGLLVYDGHDQPHVYMLTKPADGNYLNLTGHDRMPIFTRGWQPLK